MTDRPRLTLEDLDDLLAKEPRIDGMGEEELRAFGEDLLDFLWAAYLHNPSLKKDFDALSLIVKSGKIALLRGAVKTICRLVRQHYGKPKKKPEEPTSSSDITGLKH